MDLKIDHVHAVAIDLDASIEFYGKLGFSLLRRVEFGEPDDRRQLAYVGNGTMSIELVQPRDAADPLGGGTGVRPFAMTVEDADATVKELEALGVEIAMYPRPSFSFTGRTTVIKDPSGVEIELREWGGDDGPAYPKWTPARADVVDIT
jgi:catechol 2,3-dioxygenase-like lactoylglutathione lyase family enzyme